MYVGMEPCIDTIYGYTPANDVGKHLSLDLDQGNLNTAVAEGDLNRAYNFYSTGNNHHYFYLLFLFISHR
jgi:hypothetical protein